MLNDVLLDRTRTLIEKADESTTEPIEKKHAWL